jgi:hypothetical protein
VDASLAARRFNVNIVNTGCKRFCVLGATGPHAPVDIFPLGLEAKRRGRFRLALFTTAGPRCTAIFALVVWSERPSVLPPNFRMAVNIALFGSNARQLARIRERRR